MKGYYSANGFYGLVNGTYILFVSDTEYYELMTDKGE